MNPDNDFCEHWESTEDEDGDWYCNECGERLV